MFINKYAILQIVRETKDNNKQKEKQNAYSICKKLTDHPFGSSDHQSHYQGTVSINKKTKQKEFMTKKLIKDLITDFINLMTGKG